MHVDDAAIVAPLVGEVPATPGVEAPAHGCDMYRRVMVANANGPDPTQNEVEAKVRHPMWPYAKVENTDCGYQLRTKLGRVLRIYYSGKANIAGTDESKRQLLEVAAEFMKEDLSQPRRPRRRNR